MLNAWDPPQLIGNAPPSTRPGVQFPNVAVGGDRSYVVGTDIKEFDGTAVKESPLTAVTVDDGQIIGKPAGQWSFVMPTAVVSAEGRLHLLWGEPAGGTRPIPTDAWPPRDITALWTASYAPAVGWTAPQRVYEGKTLLWAPQAVATAVASSSAAHSEVSSRRIAVPVATFTGEPDQPVLLLRLGADRWTVENVPNAVRGGPVSPVYAADATREYLAYLGADPRATSADVNSVLIQRSADSGRTWTPTAVISRSGSLPAQSLQVVSTAASVVHLVWLQTVSTTGDAVLRHTMSRDGGSTWSAPQSGGTPGTWQSMRAASDICGTIHVVYEDWTHGPSAVRLLYASWNGSWTTPVPLFPGWSSRSASLVQSSANEMTLVFLGRQVRDTLSPYELARSSMRF